MTKHDRRLADLLATAIHVPRVAGAKMAAGLLVNGEWFYGFNQRKSHPLQKKFGRNECAIHMHAEISAIVHALRRYHSDELSDSIMYIARAKADGSAGLARPCSGCQKAIIEFNLGEVYYTE